MTFIYWLLLLSFKAHAQNQDMKALSYTTPTRLLSATEIPTFSDDLDLQGLELALTRQLTDFAARDMNGTITLGGKKYPLSKAVTSLKLFTTLLNTYTACLPNNTHARCEQDLNDSIRAKFNVFAPNLVKGDPRFGGPQNAFFTSYATQPINGSLKPDATHTHAIYTLPKTSKDVKQTRDAIDFKGALEGKGLDLVYGDNLFDMYLLSIEGGGYVTVDDGSGGTKNFYLQFDGTNSQPLHWISQYMLSKGYIQNLSTPAQRKYLREHPEKEEEIYSQCPAYVYYRVTQTPPMGSEGVSVTPGRSLASDSKLYAFKGLLAFVSTNKPVDLGTYDMEQEDVTQIKEAPFSRFFLDQDTGGAIQGKGRADLYMGLDAYAQYVATYEQNEGNIYFLMAK